MKKQTVLFSGLGAFAAAAAIALSPLFANSEGAAAAKGAKASVEFNLDSRPIDRSNKLRLTSYADTLSKVTPAVVSVRTAKTVRIVQRSPFRSPFDELFDLYGLPSPHQQHPGQAAPAPREEKRPMGLGSGTIIHADGYILTNRHVISEPNGEAAEEITVELSDKRTFTAKVIGSDPKTDIAVIKIEAENLPIAQVADSSALRVGDIVFAVGNPLGVGMSVSQGIVSALAREVGILNSEQGLESFIQTDASINPGNSGGPLVDADGRVVGVNTAIATPNRGSVGIGFAVPSSLAVDIVMNLVNKGGIARGYLGVEIQDVTSELAKTLGLPTPKGAFVAGVEEKSPADKAGLKPEDTIVAINGESVENASSLRYLVSRLKPGEKAKVEVYRESLKKDGDGASAIEKSTIEVVVGNQKKYGEMLPAALPGFEFAALDKALRKQHDIPASIKKGVVVTVASQDANPAVRRYLVPGTVILVVNRETVSTPEELDGALRKGQMNVLRIYVGGRIRVLQLKL